MFLILDCHVVKLYFLIFCTYWAASSISGCTHVVRIWIRQNITDHVSVFSFLRLAFSRLEMCLVMFGYCENSHLDPSSFCIIDPPAHASVRTAPLIYVSFLYLALYSVHLFCTQKNFDTVKMLSLFLSTSALFWHVRIQVRPNNTNDLGIISYLLLQRLWRDIYSRLSRCCEGAASLALLFVYYWFTHESAITSPVMWVSSHFQVLCLQAQSYAH